MSDEWKRGKFTAEWQSWVILIDRIKLVMRCQLGRIIKMREIVCTHTESMKMQCEQAAAVAAMWPAAHRGWLVDFIAINRNWRADNFIMRSFGILLEATLLEYIIFFSRNLKSYTTPKQSQLNIMYVYYWFVLSSFANSTVNYSELKFQVFLHNA